MEMIGFSAQSAADIIERITATLDEQGRSSVAISSEVASVAAMAESNNQQIQGIAQDCAEVEEVANEMNSTVSMFKL